VEPPQVILKTVEVNIKVMNRDYPLAPTYFGDKETRMKRQAARQENREIRRGERKVERSTGLEYEPRVRKRDKKL
jgi:hypothetical protein